MSIPREASPNVEQDAYRHEHSHDGKAHEITALPFQLWFDTTACFHSDLQCWCHRRCSCIRKASWNRSRSSWASARLAEPYVIGQMFPTLAVKYSVFSLFFCKSSPTSDSPPSAIWVAGNQSHAWQGLP